MVLWTKLWYYGQNYGTMDKTMVLWTKLWYYEQNYDIIPRTIELRFKHGRIPKTKKVLFIIENTLVIYQNN